jgi:hypothetical protein
VCKGNQSMWHVSRVVWHLRRFYNSENNTTLTKFCSRNSFTTATKKEGLLWSNKKGNVRMT